MIPTDQAATDDLFEQIAREHLGIDALNERGSDSLDMHEVSVWGLRGALRAAFEAGQGGLGPAQGHEATSEQGSASAGRLR